MSRTLEINHIYIPGAQKVQLKCAWKQAQYSHPCLILQPESRQSQLCDSPQTNMVHMKPLAQGPLQFVKRRITAHFPLNSSRMEAEGQAHGAGSTGLTDTSGRQWSLWMVSFLWGLWGSGGAVRLVNPGLRALSSTSPPGTRVPGETCSSPQTEAFQIDWE